ncbi:MAG: dynamin family protein [Luteolibacter sp.]
MFGERYFATRERIASVMRGIAELATGTGTDLEGKLPLEEIETRLGNPFLFVACGEVNSGKSTLINGLFGEELCKTNVLPETDRVLWYRHGRPARDVEITPMLEERYRPVEFLRDFNLVDTPGTNSVVRGHQQITERFLPTADLILFVFPITNPWGAATWDFISKLDPSLLEHVVFIVQQADQRAPNDIAVILDHLADLSRKRIGHVPPIFAVSGKSAFLAKKARPFQQKQLEESGYPALENFISKRVCESPQRRNTLKTWHSQAASALRVVEDRMEQLTTNLNRQGRFLEGVEREIDDIREQFITRLPRHLSRMAEIFEIEADWVSRQLRKRLALLPSVYRLFIGDKVASEMETLFIERLQSAVLSVAENDGDHVVSHCKEHWAALGTRVREEMGIDLGQSAPPDDILERARTRFVNRLGRVASKGIGNLKVRHQLARDLRRRNLKLKSFTFMTLLSITAGALCGAAGLPWLPWLLFGVAGIFAFGGVLAASNTRKTSTDDFRERLLDTCGSFANTLKNDYEEALRLVFQDYATSLKEVRTHLASEKQKISPKLKRWQELFLTLKAIEQEL